MNLAVFVSGRGSNLQAILDSKDLKELAKVKAVFSDKLDCPAFEKAEKHSIPHFSVGKKENYISYDEVISILKNERINLVVLAGYLKLIPVELIRLFKNQIINIHPALLPSFGGKGMYGMNVHKAVFNSSSKVSGATVHFVDETYDTGKIIAQSCVDITNVTSPEEIADKVLSKEHELLPIVIKKFAQNKIKRIGERVFVVD